MKITVICENTVGTPIGVVGEWGLAMLIEVGGKKILFDAGQRGELINNATGLGINLKEVKALVLSHGHYDHTGGLFSFLLARGQVSVYAHPDLFSLHYSALPGRKYYIGVPFRQEQLTSLGAEFIFSREPMEIVPSLWASGEVPHQTPFEAGDSRLLCLEEGNYKKDPICDDMSLYCLTSEGLIVILGCAHAGVVNIIEYARQLTGEKRVYGVIGGTHLGPVSEAQQEATINYLAELDLKFLAANHCTGLPMISRLATIFGSRFYFAPAGASFNLPLKEERV